MEAEKSDFVVRKSIKIKAAPDEVWEALTNPEKTKKYFFNCRVFSDWKEGSRIEFKGRMFLIKKIEMKGHILGIEPEKFLKYNLENGKENSGSVSTVTEELTYSNGATNLVVTDDVGAGEGAEKRFRRSEKGWDKVLKGLKQLVEDELGD
ncbi:MAG: SRPBCC domain-containing protein [Bacteroidia bacterium]